MDASQALEKNVRVAFPAKDAGMVIAALVAMPEPAAVTPEWVVARARVQIAVLMRADGDIELLHKAIEQSQVDWRDTLVGAGLGNADWPSVAGAAGYSVPRS